ncbi:hypothetical protein AKO1_002278 [Acrasis kona]|uniref:Uncharacterized protein n=1 Tax=Acrasis kona TaxID=1008807 RepID=A0AAW2ZPL2_9EUKA
MSRLFEAFLISGAGVIIWLFSLLRSTGTKPRLRAKQTKGEKDNGINEFFEFMKTFASRGGLKSVFPGDDSRDTSVQFELISQVNCTTSVGKPISVTVRNTPQDRRRMRMFGGF